MFVNMYTMFIKMFQNYQTSLKMQRPKKQKIKQMMKLIDL